MAKLRAEGLVTANEDLRAFQETGVTVAEINKLDGVSSSTAELNYVVDATYGGFGPGGLQGAMGGTRFSGNVVSDVGPVNWSSTSTGYAELADLKCTITPTHASSRMWIMCRTAQHHSSSPARTHSSSGTKLYRGNTDLGGFNQVRAQLTDLAANAYVDRSTVLQHIDHPNTTSAVEYTLQGRTGQSGKQAYFHHSYVPSHTWGSFMAVFELKNGQTYGWS